MGRQTYRKTADVLRKTIEELEADPTIDTRKNASFEMHAPESDSQDRGEQGPRAESVIHLVAQAAASERADADCHAQQDSDSAIA